MKKEDDISVEVLPNPGEIKIHLPLYYQYIKSCVCRSVWKVKKKPTKTKKPQNPHPNKPENRTIP